ncbi:hypothetical protein [Bacillus swezeyi]|uniref:hypothetical protein n=1 Tax=Bacillus swezeyi TaxID=1925020 RepID=UPI003F8C7537
MSVCDYKTLPRKIEPQVIPFVFHDSVTEPGESAKLIVGSHLTLTVEITGDCTSREVKFFSVTQDETVKSSSLSTWLKNQSTGYYVQRYKSSSIAYSAGAWASYNAGAKYNGPGTYVLFY